MSSQVQLIDTKQAMQIIGCSLHTFKGYLSRGSLYPCKKVGGKNFYNEETIKNFVPPSQAIEQNRGFRQSPSSSGIALGEMRNVISKWQTTSYDTSSSDVQIGIYTEQIQQLEIDMGASYREDPAFAGMRKLLIKYVFERRRLLNYLQTSDFRRYRKAMSIINSNKAA